MRLRKHLPESDVFAMGVILYELLSGIHPFCPKPLSVMGTSMRLLEYVPPPPLATLGLDIPLDVSDVVQRTLSPEPEDRGSAQDLAEALEASQQRLRVRKRASAQSLPVPGQDTPTAPTEPSLPAMNPGGAAPPVTPGPTTERRTTLPMAPVGPVTAPSPQHRAPPATMPMRLPEIGAPDDRRSTGVPVEKVGHRPSSSAAATTASRHRLALWVTAGAVVLGAGIAGGGWILWGDASGIREHRTAARRAAWSEGAEEEDAALARPSPKSRQRCCWRPF